jgi:hypothetical protein
MCGVAINHSFRGHIACASTIIASKSGGRAAAKAARRHQHGRRWKWDLGRRV